MHDPSTETTRTRKAGPGLVPCLPKGWFYIMCLHYRVPSCKNQRNNYSLNFGIEDGIEFRKRPVGYSNKIQVTIDKIWHLLLSIDSRRLGFDGIWLIFCRDVLAWLSFSEHPCQWQSQIRYVLAQKGNHLWNSLSFRKCLILVFRRWVISKIILLPLKLDQDGLASGSPLNTAPDRWVPKKLNPLGLKPNP